jgi:hypothetical protein
MEVFRLTAEASLLMGPRYIAVALWVLIAKGKGKIVADVPKLMETIFPGEAFDLRVFKNWLAELKAAGVIELVKDGEQWMIRQGGGGLRVEREPAAPEEEAERDRLAGAAGVPLFGEDQRVVAHGSPGRTMATAVPDLDVLQECRQALSWVMCNPPEDGQGDVAFSR